VDVQFYDWYAVFAPSRTPPAVLEVLQRALRQAAHAPDFVAALDKGSEHVDYLDGEPLKAWYAHEQKWRIEAVRAIGKIQTK
jgi:tripartite-type tricarboxylate transporter receptor subunit TctC